MNILSSIFGDISSERPPMMEFGQPVIPIEVLVHDLGFSTKVPSAAGRAAPRLPAHWQG